MESGPSAATRTGAVNALMEYLSRPDYRPMPQRELLQRLRVPPEARPAIRRLLKELIREGRITRVRGDRLARSGERGTILGRVEVLGSGGKGLVAPEDGSPQVVVPRPKMADARRGDLVSIRVTGPGADGKPEGVVVSVMERADRRLIGVFRRRGRSGVIEPLDGSRQQALHVPAAFRMGARDGDAVAAESRPSGAGVRNREARVLEVIGPLSAPGVDVSIVIRKYGLCPKFPEDVLGAAASLPDGIAPQESRSRERFDEPPPVTIDGETAKDFDDAVAVEERPGGGFRLYVHIADVSHFVPPRGALDREAQARGTSVYFPGTVLPMFPERLSNELCSLRPLEDRLVQSVVIDFDRSGRARKTRVADGIIRSAARLTYTQAARVLDGRKRGHGVPGPLVPMLRAADRLRTILEKRRRARGSIDVDLPEPQILLDVEGVMTGVTVEPRNRAHRLVEEFMIAANEAVARFLTSRGAPCVYRIHERPDPAKIEVLAEFVRKLGLEFRKAPHRIGPVDLQRLLDEAEGRADYRVVAQMTLRSMKQARYTTAHAGHFGLASKTYCHFTSPIRRYPDLLVHRILRDVRGGRPARYDAEGELEALAANCSALERNAEAAEREVLNWKAVTFLREREGDTFDGVVTGVAPFGLFVELTETLVDGLLRVEELGAEYFDFVESHQELRGTRTGRSYRLGDHLRVCVTRVDLVRRRVDLALDPGVPLENPKEKRGAGRESSAKGGRRRHRSFPRRRAPRR